MRRDLRALAAPAVLALAAGLALSTLGGAWSVWHTEGVVTVPGFSMGFATFPGSSTRFEMEHAFHAAGIHSASDGERDFEAYTEDPDASPLSLLFRVVSALVILGALAALGAAAASVTALRATDAQGRRRAGRLALAGATAAALLLLAVPVVVAAGFPPAVAASDFAPDTGNSPGATFWGEDRGGSTRTEWGAGAAWWLSLVAGAMACGAAGVAWWRSRAPEGAPGAERDGPAGA